MQLVVAHYSENLSWLEKVKPYVDEITVYTCANGEPYAKSMREVSPQKIARHSIINAGQESFAYACFAAFPGPRYEYTIFCQGSPFDHAADNADNDPKDFIAWVREFKANPRPFKYVGAPRTCPANDRLHFRYRFRPRSPMVSYVLDPVPDTDQLNPRQPMLDLWSALLPTEPAPKEWRYAWGNQFAVHRDLIMSRPVEFWDRLVKVLSHDPKPLEATACERMWGAFLGVRA